MLQNFIKLECVLMYRNFNKSNCVMKTYMNLDLSNFSNWPKAITLNDKTSRKASTDVEQ